MPAKLSQDDIDLLRDSPLFDEDYYLEHNPDVAARGVDPVKHYLRRGARQGRDPSADFSSTGYLRNNRDVMGSDVNPLVHYLRHGRREGRTANPFAAATALIRESGMFDEDYYRFYHPELPDDEDAIVHYLRVGASLGLDPSEKFSTRVYLHQNPDVAQTESNPLVHYLQFGRAEGRLVYRSRMRRPMFELIYQERWPHLQPLPLVHVPVSQPRVTVLTDSVSAGSFFGGVGTALILGILLANRLGGPLRLVTRSDGPDGRVVSELEKAHGLALAGPLELNHLPLDGSRTLSISPADLVITTSWWTTRAALDSTLRREQVLYLLQEDERMFYPRGDERLLCTETLAEPDLAILVNTQRLLDHLSTPGGEVDLSHATSFEPAFPGAGPTPRDPGAKRGFFFYSRPENARNLFWRGGLALSRAVEKRILDPDVWDFHFVGRATPEVTLPGDVAPHIHEGLAWADYQALVAQMDAALVLMDTPHPSYPPYDLAGAGAAVLTNTHPGKSDLSDVSANILVADPSLEGLVAGLGRLAALGVDDDQRLRNRREDHIGRDWNASLAEVVESLVSRFGPTLGKSADVH
jgi:hypothetical protein